LEIWHKELDIRLEDYRKTSAISKGPADQKANLKCFTYEELN